MRGASRVPRRQAGSVSAVACQLWQCQLWSISCGSVSRGESAAATIMAAGGAWGAAVVDDDEWRVRAGLTHVCRARSQLRRTAALSV